MLGGVESTEASQSNRNGTHLDGSEDTVVASTEQSKAASFAFDRPFSLFGIKFAPLLVPIERRKQTAAVLAGIMLTYWCPVFCSIFAIALLFTPFFFLPLAYFAWIYYDRETPQKGGRRVPLIRSMPMWNHFRDYFPITLTKTADLDPSRNYIFGCHPHGVFALGPGINFCTEATNFASQFPGIKSYVLTLGVQFRCPFARDYQLALGMCDVSRSSIRHILNSGVGHAVMIVVGGAEEALEAHPGTFKVLLSKRKGFVRQAIMNGADLVPCYSFGENDIFSMLDNSPGTLTRLIQNFFKKTMGFSPPFVYGRGIFNYTFGLMPYRKPIDTVVGKPIRVERDENPSSDLVDHYHKLYTDALSEIFESHKARHNIAADVRLSVI